MSSAPKAYLIKKKFTNESMERVGLHKCSCSEACVDVDVLCASFLDGGVVGHFGVAVDDDACQSECLSVHVLSSFAIFLISLAKYR